MEEIKYFKDDNGVLMATVIPSGYSKPGITFITDDESSMQVALMQHPAGHKIKPHFHNALPRNVVYTCETLVIRKGMLQVSLYSDMKKIGTFSVGTGDILTLYSGGHSFKIIEDTDMVEIKQGPYMGEADKTRFDELGDRQ